MNDALEWFHTVHILNFECHDFLQYCQIKKGFLWSFWKSRLTVSRRNRERKPRSVASSGGRFIWSQLLTSISHLGLVFFEISLHIMTDERNSWELRLKLNCLLFTHAEVIRKIFSCFLAKQVFQSVLQAIDVTRKKHISSALNVTVRLFECVFNKRNLFCFSFFYVSCEDRSDVNLSYNRQL